MGSGEMRTDLRRSGLDEGGGVEDVLFQETTKEAGT